MIVTSRRGASPALGPMGRGPGSFGMLLERSKGIRGVTEHVDSSWRGGRSVEEARQHLARAAGHSRTSTRR
jgi:hypothetical protein